MKMKWIAAALLGWSMGCVAPADVPSNVKDLRVLGVQLEPPEVMAPVCTQDLLALAAAYAQRIHYTALIADPAGEGRAIEAELLACASTADRVCDTQGERYVLQPLSEVPPGDLFLDLDPVANTGFPDNPLLEKVIEKDPYRGLGGVRVPLVLHLRAGDEEIYAQKLMIYSCRFSPDQTQNANPSLPGVRISGAAWGVADTPMLEGPGPFAVEPDPFDQLQEAYVVPSFQLQPVELVESWKIAWYADYGQFAPEETGGTDLGGTSSRYRAQWSPPGGAVERDVKFWMVVRDGRGGTSWLVRTAHYRP